MAKLVIADGEEVRVLPIQQPMIRLGRADDNDVVLDRPSVSRRHAQLEQIRAGVYRIRDLGSTNGTYLNGDPVTSMTLEVGDRILVGQVLLLVTEDDADLRDALLESGLLFPWRPVRADADPTPLVSPGGRLGGAEPLASSSPRARRVREETQALRRVQVHRRRSGAGRRERQERVRDLLPKLSHLGLEAGGPAELGDLIALILAELTYLVAGDRALLMLYDAETRSWEASVAYHLAYGRLSGDAQQRLCAFCEFAVREGHPVTCRDAEAAGMEAPRTPRQDAGVHALAVPLLVPGRVQGRERRRPAPARVPVGAVYLESGRGGLDATDTGTAELVHAVSAFAAIALQTARLRYLASTDPMTRVGNRLSTWEVLRSELDLARQGNGRLGVILLDLDRLKQVNDAWGHATGDEVIKRVARRLRRCVRREDYVARWGGEEFLVVVPGIDASGLTAVARKVQQALSSAPIGEMRLRITASLGMALFPEHAETAEALVERADIALYQAKEGGRNRIKLYGHSGFG